MWQSLYSAFAIPKITDAIMNNLPGINLKPSKHWVPYPDHGRPRIRSVNPVAISIDFDDFTLPFTLSFLSRLRSYIKHSRECFIGYLNTSNLVKNIPLRVVFSTLFSVFGYPDETLFLVLDTAISKKNKGGKFLKKLWCCVGGSITR